MTTTVAFDYGVGNTTKLFNLSNPPSQTLVECGCIFGTTLCHLSAKLVSFGKAYSRIHHYICIFLIPFGLVVNSVLTILILRGKGKGRPVTSRLLVMIGLACTIPLPFQFVYYIQFRLLSEPGPAGGHSYAWGIFVLLSILVWITARAMSLLAVITLATFQVVMVCKRSLALVYCTAKRACLAIFLIVFLALLLSAPGYLAFRVASYTHPTKNVTSYWTEYNDKSWLSGQTIRLINFWIHGFVLGICGSILMTCLCVVLISASRRMSRVRRRLLSGSRRAKALRRSQQTIYALAVLILLVVISEVPNGSALLLTHIYRHTYFKCVYTHLGDFFDLLLLLKDTFCVFIYCTLVEQLRATVSLFTKKVLLRCSGRVNGNDGHIEVKQETVATFPDIVGLWSSSAGALQFPSTGLGQALYEAMLRPRSASVNQRRQTTNRQRACSTFSLPVDANTGVTGFQSTTKQPSVHVVTWPEMQIHKISPVTKQTFSATVPEHNARSI